MPGPPSTSQGTPAAATRTFLRQPRIEDTLCHNTCSILARCCRKPASRNLLPGHAPSCPSWLHPSTCPAELPSPPESTSLRLHPRLRRCPIPNACPTAPYTSTTSSPPLPHPLPSSSRSPSGPSGTHHLVPGSPLGCTGYWLAHTLNSLNRWMRSSGVKSAGRDKSRMAGTPQPSAANDWIRAALRTRARGQQQCRSSEAGVWGAVRRHPCRTHTHNGTCTGSPSRSCPSAVAGRLHKTK